ncbi:hypothetical protein C8J30_11154 [Rhodobacter viridis]|uniref:Uncharacterized protein n=1 Tax=Rhodobacter viridis TaxID=1054202 RepID=A0A318TV77_9RHOB|nr:hypothetical protein [Rhodobacter viridis]PYF08726.1 hypothetical protein C8J30_11154 [Rhodobacter viridis]
MSRPLSLTIAAPIATLFGLATILSGGRVLFGGVDMGIVVPFVLWFNFGAGFAYVAAGLGLWRGAGWARWLAFALAVSTGIVFAAFLAHVLDGGAYEARTMAVMMLRLCVWSAIATLALRTAPWR